MNGPSEEKNGNEWVRIVLGEVVGAITIQNYSEVTLGVVEKENAVDRREKLQEEQRRLFDSPVEKFDGKRSPANTARRHTATFAQKMSVRFDRKAVDFRESFLYHYAHRHRSSPFFVLFIVTVQYKTKHKRKHALNHQ